MSPGDTLINAIADAVAERLTPMLLESGAQVKARLLSVKEAAVYCGRTTNSFRLLYPRHDVPVVQMDGRVMFDRGDLDCWIERSKMSRR